MLDLIESHGKITFTAYDGFTCVIVIDHNREHCISEYYVYKDNCVDNEMLLWSNCTSQLDLQSIMAHAQVLLDNHRLTLDDEWDAHVGSI